MGTISKYIIICNIGVITEDIEFKLEQVVNYQKDNNPYHTIRLDNYLSICYGVRSLFSTFENQALTA